MLKLAGENCERIMGRYVRNVKVADVQADEIWGFVQKKEAHKRPSEAHDNSIGDAYTFVAIERDSKLVLNFALGRRDTATTQIFIEGLRDAIAPGQFQRALTALGRTFQPSTIRLGTALTSRKSSRFMRTIQKDSAGTRQPTFRR
jgi:hypothetical protein